VPLPDAYARSFTDGDEIFFGGMEDHWNVPACRFDPSGRYARFAPKVTDFVAQRVTRNRCDHVTPGRHSSELFADAAVRFLEDAPRGSPFLLYVAFMAPHDPRTMPPEYAELHPPADLALPPNAWPAHPFDNGELLVRDERLAASPRDAEEVRRHLSAYYGMIAHADAQVGRILDALRAAGREDDTVVAFSGDNGLALGQHGLMGKQSLYDHSLRVPLVLAGPGVPRGERRDALCYLHDLFPTLCDLCGIATPASVDARSLAPALRDPREPHRPALHFAYGAVQRGARDARFKRIDYAVGGRRTAQLFDLEADPWETRNLAGEPGAAAHFERLGRELERWPAELGDTREAGRAFWSAARAGPAPGFAAAPGGPHA